MSYSEHADALTGVILASFSLVIPYKMSRNTSRPQSSIEPILHLAFVAIVLLLIYRAIF